MSRPLLASLIGIAGFIAYVVVVVTLADHIIGLHWIAGVLYFPVAGFVWVFPAARLIRWARADQGGRPAAGG
ncbi:MAG: DUF2842 domain-containing protein [Alphaproteobacteria bacterium]|nr:DUF2842 domain-containing protein [Alphaproteobacteria bacterium]